MADNNTKASGSDIVLRGMMLLALMLIVIIGGYAIFFRKPSQTAAPTAADLTDPPSAPGWQTRFEATRSLAHHGSNEVSWDVYREMLDERRQFCNFRTKLPDGTTVVEESAARQIIIGALKDLATWHTKQDRAKVTPGEKLLAVYEKVDQLAKSEIPELKREAEQTQATLFR